MCRPIRILTEAKGYDAGLHNLASFGGAGGQHACEIARKLGISRVLIHKYSSVLSAYGMALAEVVVEERSPCTLVYSEDQLGVIARELDNIQSKSVKALLKQRITESRVVSERYLNMRFQGSDTPLMIQETTSTDFLTAFKEAHQQQFGFLPVGRDVIVDDYRVRSIGASGAEMPTLWKTELAALKEIPVTEAEMVKEVYFKELGWDQTQVHKLGALRPGSKIKGPALVIDNTQTIVITPGATATILSDTVVIDVEVGNKEALSTRTVDPIQLSIFGHRFMGVAEQMGRALQKTSVSTNIKERLDFSCTVFSPDGGLVANAPHVPAMVCFDGGDVRQFMPSS